MNFTKVSVASLLVTMIAGGTLAHATCSNASIKGTYGIVSTGLNGSLQPASSVDQITVDGLGHVSGTSTKSIDGTIVTYTITGSYNIAAKCHGTDSFNNQSGQTDHDNIYLNNANARAFLIQTDKTPLHSTLPQPTPPST